MSIVVFCGPTLSREDVLGVLDADVRPPASRGDVLRAGLGKPAAIGIVDGYFDGAPSIWHKEILWAMSEGIHVFGAGSMGALRAAELAPFGMDGVGVVFESFRSGDLSDDDEVAVAHAPASEGFRALSDAMVNIRATLHAAVRAGVLSERGRIAVEDAAKELAYPDRCYPIVIRAAERAGMPSSEADRLRGWLPGGRVDQKREDALAMLRCMADRARDGWQRKQVSFKLSHTDAWESLWEHVISEGSSTAAGGSVEVGVDELCDELRASGELGAAIDAAAVRALCIRSARHSGFEVNPRAVEAVAEEFRRERGLLSPEQFAAWLKSEELEEEEMAKYFTREAVVRRLRATVEFDQRACLVDHLRATGRYGALAARVRAKREAPRTVGGEPKVE